MNPTTVTIPPAPAFRLEPTLPGVEPALPPEVRSWYVAATAVAATLAELLEALWDRLDDADTCVLQWCRTMTADDDAALELLGALQDSGGSGPAQTYLLSVGP